MKGSPFWVPSSVAVTVNLKEIAGENLLGLFGAKQDYSLGAVSQGYLILPQMKLNLQLSHCAFLQVDIPFPCCYGWAPDYSGRIYFALITVDYPVLTVTRPGAKHFSFKDQKCQVWTILS